VIPGRGSGIFLHASTGRPTLGCVALALPNLLIVLRSLRPELEPLIAVGTADQLARF
jgi:L,D-peptidoglycan transpeptidase YkuD (ErfK/YbiS/YcfS/YnhG family)